MKLIPSLAAAAACLVLGVSCSDSEVSAAGVADNAKNITESAGDLDLTKLSPEQMSSKVTELSGSVIEKLGSIKDLDSAKEAVGILGPMLDKMETLKTTLGDKLPDLSGLKTAADGLATKFMADSGIMEVLKPMLDKIKAMIA